MIEVQPWVALLGVCCMFWTALSIGNYAVAEYRFWRRERRKLQGRR